eukprot:TRINITY_DN1097_c0_g1_i1.p1 TRINITY_DN1097_c0_g1~~TRINITY_DN1097_c0_g1_i1.p1  ORF type:complete len:584 (+),score=255.33 TRINITY_DN1097_c0_g1_i1:33-1754(+)
MGDQVSRRATLVAMRAVVLVFCLVATLAAAQYAERHLLYSREVTPPRWTLGGHAPRDAPVKFTLALKQRNLDQLEEKFWAVSDPKSPHYGKHMTRQQIWELISPPHSQVHRVIAWLKHTGVHAKQISNQRDALVVTTTVAVASRLFHADLHVYTHVSGRRAIRSWGDHSIPAELRNIVDFVAGISDFPMDRYTTKKVHAANDLNVAPQTLRLLYNIPEGYSARSNSSQAPVEFQNDASFGYPDLAQFWNLANIKTDNVSHVVGPFDGSNPDTEATLDIQYITAIGVGVDNWYWTTTNWMYDWGVEFFGHKSIPLVVSLSWGWSEAAQCDIDTKCSTLGIDSKQYVNRTNVEFQKIGLRGVSILVASGDSGANSRVDEGCTDNHLNPDFPAASPYVTSVGGTQLSSPSPLANPPALCSSNACAGAGPEEAVSYDVAGYTSGGGFSLYSARPNYQAAAVNAYLKSGVQLPPASYYNAAGRGYPDIAANGHNFLCVLSGGISPVGGTSASAPTVAGMVGLWNDARLAQGKPALGFLNPLLYEMFAKNPAIFNDITKGDNKVGFAFCCCFAVVLLFQ